MHLWTTLLPLKLEPKDKVIAEIMSEHIQLKKDHLPKVRRSKRSNTYV
jgi:hypothetical protein